MNQRQEIFLEKYPTIKSRFEELCAVRRDEIVEDLLVTDEQYKLLTKCRATTSQKVLHALDMCGKSEQLDCYSDAVSEEEVYRVSTIYKEALLDAVEMLQMLKILQ